MKSARATSTISEASLPYIQILTRCTVQDRGGRGTAGKG